MSEADLMIDGYPVWMIEELPGLYLSEERLFGFVKKENSELIPDWSSYERVTDRVYIVEGLVRNLIVINGVPFVIVSQKLFPRRDDRFFTSPGKMLVIEKEEGYYLYQTLEGDTLDSVLYDLFFLDASSLPRSLFSKSEMLAVLLGSVTEEEQQFARKFLARLEDSTEFFDRAVPEEFFCYKCSRFFCSRLAVEKHPSTKTHTNRKPKIGDTLQGLADVWRKRLGLLEDKQEQKKLLDYTQMPPNAQTTED